MRAHGTHVHNEVGLLTFLKRSSSWRRALGAAVENQRCRYEESRTPPAAQSPLPCVRCESQSDGSRRQPESLSTSRKADLAITHSIWKQDAMTVFSHLGYVMSHLRGQFTQCAKCLASGKEKHTTRYLYARMERYAFVSLWPIGSSARQRQSLTLPHYCKVPRCPCAPAAIRPAKEGRRPRPIRSLLGATAPRLNCFFATFHLGRRLLLRSPFPQTSSVFALWTAAVHARASHSFIHPPIFPTAALLLCAPQSFLHLLPHSLRTITSQSIRYPSIPPKPTSVDSLSSQPPDAPCKSFAPSLSTIPFMPSCT